MPLEAGGGATLTAVDAVAAVRAHARQRAFCAATTLAAAVAAALFAFTALSSTAARVAVFHASLARDVATPVAVAVGVVDANGALTGAGAAAVISRIAVPDAAVLLALAGGDDGNGVAATAARLNAGFDGTGWLVVAVRVAAARAATSAAACRDGGWFPAATPCIDFAACSAAPFAEFAARSPAVAPLPEPAPLPGRRRRLIAGSATSAAAAGGSSTGAGSLVAAARCGYRALSSSATSTAAVVALPALGVPAYPYASTLRLWPQRRDACCNTSAAGSGPDVAPCPLADIADAAATRDPFRTCNGTAGATLERLAGAGWIDAATVEVQAQLLLAHASGGVWGSVAVTWSRLPSLDWSVALRVAAAPAQPYAAAPSASDVGAVDSGGGIAGLAAAEASAIVAAVVLVVWLAARLWTIGFLLWAQDWWHVSRLRRPAGATGAANGHTHDAAKCCVRPSPSYPSVWSLAVAAVRSPEVDWSLLAHTLLLAAAWTQLGAWSRTQNALAALNERWLDVRARAERSSGGSELSWWQWYLAEASTDSDTLLDSWSAVAWSQSVYVDWSLVTIIALTAWLLGIAATSPRVAVFTESLRRILIDIAHFTVPMALVLIACGVWALATFGPFLNEWTHPLDAAFSLVRLLMYDYDLIAMQGVHAVQAEWLWGGYMIVATNLLFWMMLAVAMDAYAGVRGEARSHPPSHVEWARGLSVFAGIADLIPGMWLCCAIRQRQPVACEAANGVYSGCITPHCRRHRRHITAAASLSSEDGTGSGLAAADGLRVTIPSSAPATHAAPSPPAWPLDSWVLLGALTAVVATEGPRPVGAELASAVARRLGFDEGTLGPACVQLSLRHAVAAGVWEEMSGTEAALHMLQALLRSARVTLRRPMPAGKPSPQADPAAPSGEGGGSSGDVTTPATTTAAVVAAVPARTGAGAGAAAAAAASVGDGVATTGAIITEGSAWGSAPADEWR